MYAIFLFFVVLRYSFLICIKERIPTFSQPESCFNMFFYLFSVQS